MKLLLAFMVLLLASCSKHSDGTSVWAGGLFVLPLATFAGMLFFLWKSWKASRSGSWYWGKDANGVPAQVQRKENVPIHKTGWFYFVLGLAAATIYIILDVNGNK